jgi:hypothetical protein
VSGTHWPVHAQVAPAEQLPQEPPHPSSPQASPVHCGTQPATHCWLALQEEPVAQEPQEPPQPSDPHCLPLQLGVQTPQTVM